MPPGGAVKVRVLAFKGSRDDPPDGVLAFENRPGFFAKLVELLKRNHVLVGGNLENAVRRGIDYGFSGGDVLPSVVHNELRAAVRLVAENIEPRCFGEGVDYLLREAVRIGRKRSFRHEPRQLPVPGGGVLAHALFAHAPKGAQGRSRFFDTGNAVDISKPEAYHIGNIKLPGGGAGSKGVAPLVAEKPRVRKLADSEGVEHYPKNSLYLFQRAFSPFSISS